MERFRKSQIVTKKRMLGGKLQFDRYVRTGGGLAEVKKTKDFVGRIMNHVKHRIHMPISLPRVVNKAKIMEEISRSFSQM